MLKPSDIVSDVETTMRTWRPGKTALPATAYQWLDRLPITLRTTLIAERGMPGRNSGNSYSAAQVVSDALEMLSRENKVEISYHDSEGELFIVAGQTIEPGYAGGVCARYRYL